MIRTNLAKKVLTKKEQKHLTESGINSMAAMERQVKHIQERIDEDGDNCVHVCFDCKMIARKLGFKFKI